MIDRRQLMRAGGALATVAVARPVAAMQAGQAAGSADAQLATLLDAHVDAFLKRSPEEATGNDFDTGAHADLRARLDDRSIAALARDHAAVKEAKRQIDAIPVAALSQRARQDHAVASFVYATLDDVMGHYGYVDANLRPSPYVVSQMNGAYYWLPDFIGGRHPLENNADAEAWQSRLAALATALDQESERIAADAARGVTPPDFVIERTVTQIEGLRDGDPLQSSLIAPAMKRMADKRLAPRDAAALAIFRERIAPALTRQADALKALLPGASSDGGVWRLPGGDAYYAAAVKANTTVDTPPGELHAIGLAQCEELAAQIDTLLKAQGLTKGSLYERIGALQRDPRFRVSDDDAGRARLIALAEAQIAAITARLPQAFGITDVDPIVVRRIPQAVEAGAPGAFYSRGGAGRGGTYSLNLARPGDLATWRMPTLTHHESVPGHHFQYGVLSRAPELPRFRRIARFSAYTEGWALYAEQVAAEIGIYDDDPFGRIGFLQSQMFRAARIVVDTGMHHHRWSKAKAVDWMVENVGEPRAATDREVTRYAVYPGQACSFKVGANAIHAARERARAKMGARFDVRAFHDLVLTSGPMPMSVLDQSVNAWTEKA